MGQPTLQMGVSAAVTVCHRLDIPLHRGTHRIADPDTRCKCAAGLGCYDASGLSQPCTRPACWREGHVQHDHLLSTPAQRLPACCPADQPVNLVLLPDRGQNGWVLRHLICHVCHLICHGWVARRQVLQRFIECQRHTVLRRVICTV
jgi:hypothetical protein